MFDRAPGGTQIGDRNAETGSPSCKRISQRALGLSLRAIGATLVLGSLACQCKSPRKGSVVDFKIEVLDSSDKPLPCRIHLRDPDGKIWTSPAWPAFDDHFVYPGSSSFVLQAGTYSYEIERGPEYRPLVGTFVVSTAGEKSLRVKLERSIDLASLGWYAGDLHIHRRVEDVPLLMQAEDLYVGPVLTWGNDGSQAAQHWPASPARFDGGRFMDPTAGEDERAAGALLYFRLKEPLKLPPLVREDNKISHRLGDVRDEYPSPTLFATQARAQASAHVAIEKPFWWDTPTWIALGLADSIGIAHNHMDRSSVHTSEAWGKPRDPAVYGKGLHANGYYTQDIYYQLLNAGIRIAPSAGSASGVLANPVGYDRVYVYTGERLEYASWWDGLRAGHSFVTNGPLLLVTANGMRPGQVFQATNSAPLQISLQVRLVSNDPIEKVELVRDGKSIERGAYDAAHGTVAFSALSFGESGWFLVRAICERQDTFRFASTAPFYVEFGNAPRRISRAAARLFSGWVDERIKVLQTSVSDPANRDAVLAPHRQAALFWRTLIERANAE